MGIPDKFKVSFNPDKVRKKTLLAFLKKTNLLDRLAQLRRKDDEIFLKIILVRSINCNSFI